jgi:ribosomal protein S18 acetylase RimI-like enzyme
MPRLLSTEDFDGSKLGSVQGFDCGPEEWAKYATAWIKAPPDQIGALKSMTRGTSVWLYYDPDDALVGFGSLGTTRWPNFGGGVAIIPQIGIDGAFHGQPRGHGETKYSHQIMDDLVGRALQLDVDHLVLTVDPRNEKAIALYRSFQFSSLSDPSPLGHVKMALLLREPRRDSDVPT